MNHDVTIQADALSEVYFTSYECDAVGNLTKFTDPNGGQTFMVYDGVNRLVNSYDNLVHP